LIPLISFNYCMSLIKVDYNENNLSFYPSLIPLYIYLIYLISLISFIQLLLLTYLLSFFDSPLYLFKRR